MKQIKYDSDEHLDAIKRRALIMKPNAPNVIATSMGWEQSRPNGTLELLVSFADLDSILGIEVAPEEDDEPLAVNIMSDLAIEDDSDEDLPPPNKLASDILAKPVEKVEVADKSALEAFLAQSKADEEDEAPEVVEVIVTPKKKGGRPKKEVVTE